MKNIMQSHEKTLICDANTGMEEYDAQGD